MYAVNYVTYPEISNSQEKESQPPTLILMAGFPGAGKTTLARALGRILRWPVIDKDRCKVSILNTNRGVTSVDASWLAYDLFFTLADDLLVKQGLSIILDTASLHPFITEQTHNLIQNAGAEYKVILCDAPYEVRRERIRKRNELPSEYQLYTSPTAFTEQDGLEHFSHLPLNHAEIVDTTKSIEECLRRALNYIRGLPWNYGIS